MPLQARLEDINLHDRTGRLEKHQGAKMFGMALHDRTGRLEIG